MPRKVTLSYLIQSGLPDARSRKYKKTTFYWFIQSRKYFLNGDKFAEISSSFFKHLATLNTIQYKNGERGNIYYIKTL